MTKFYKYTIGIWKKYNNVHFNDRFDTVVNTEYDFTLDDTQ